MEAHRQAERVFEEHRRRGEATAVGQAVGQQRHDHRGADREQREADPGDDQRQQLREFEPAAVLRAMAQAIDQPAEQDRLGELGDHQDHGADDERGDHALLACEQAEDPAIETEERHGEP